MLALRVLVFAGLATLAALPVGAQARFTGVNLAGAEFGDSQLPGTYGVHYTYPTPAEVDHFVGIGMNVFRVPFRWERIQRSLNGELDAGELARLDAFVDDATEAGATVVLDPHNYARYNGAVVGSAALPNSAFGDFWTRLANRYKVNSRVAFGLMNEPNSMPTEQWLAAANAAIEAIRATGATNLILVPGNGYTGAHSWYSSWYGTPNATVMLGVVDTANNFAFDVHQYLDDDSSGQSPTCTSAIIGTERLTSMTSWLRANNMRAFLGEFGGADNPTCLAALDNMLNHIDANTDVWIGWTYWAAGPWWGDYMFSIEPDAQGDDRLQTAVLAPHFATTVGTGEAPSDAAPALTLSPNPSRDQTSVTAYLFAPSPVEVCLLDALGRTVRRIDAGALAAGAHTLPLDVSDLAPGVYVVRLVAGAGVQTRRLVVAR